VQGQGFSPDGRWLGARYDYDRVGPGFVSNSSVLGASRVYSGPDKDGAVDRIRTLILSNTDSSTQSVTLYLCPNERTLASTTYVPTTVDTIGPSISLAAGEMLVYDKLTEIPLGNGDQVHLVASVASKVTYCLSLIREI